MDVPSPKQVVRRWVDAFNAQDPEALAELYHEDAVNHQVANDPVCGAAAIPVAPAPVQEAEPEGLYITAPLVGTFYAAPAPGAEPFVKVGDAVKRGQTVCLLEAMKMMSEVKAPCDCVIEAILPQDGALVSYGDALVRYREG